MTDEEIYENLSKEEKDALQFFDLVEGDNSDTGILFNKNHGIFGLLFHNKLNLDFKGIRRFIFIGSGVLTLNGILLTAVFLKALFGEMSFSGRVNLILIIGALAAGGYTIYRAYGYALIHSFYVFYDKFISTGIRSLAAELVDKAAEILAQNPNMSKHEFHDLLDIGGKIESYLSIFPKFIKKIFLGIFKQIPIVGYLIQFREFIVGDMREKAIDKIYGSIDGFFRTWLEDALTLSWLWYLVPLNIVIYLIVIL